MSSAVRIGDSLRELLTNRLLEVTEDPHETYVAQYDAATTHRKRLPEDSLEASGSSDDWFCHPDCEACKQTLKQSEGVDIIPLRLHFENGQTLICYVAGWSVEKP